MFILVTFIVALAHPLLATIAYDCTRPIGKITFSLLDTGDDDCHVLVDQLPNSDQGTPDPLRRSLEVQKCEMKKIRNANIIAMAPTAPHWAASNIMGPGWAGFVRGEVLHVIKCTPVDVVPEPESGNGNCYKEIPVKFEGRSLFMTAANRFLQIEGTQVPCLEDFLNGKVKKDSPVEEWSWEGLYDMFLTFGRFSAGAIGLVSYFLGMVKIQNYFMAHVWPFNLRVK